MASVSSLRKYGKYFVLSIMAIAFIVTAPGVGHCYTQINTTLPHITLPPSISISPNPAYVGQTITIRGSGFNTTTHPGDSYPTAYCNAYCDEHGYLLPIRIQSDGTFVVQPTLKSPGSDELYAYDNWGDQSNKVTMTVTNPVTFVVKVVDGKNASYVSNGVLCLKYPTSSASHYENSIIGSTYTTKMAFNGTSAEIWIRQSPLTTDHQTIANIQAGQTYTVTLTMPINTPTPTATPTAQPGTETVTPVPTQDAQATASPTSQPSTQPGMPDTAAPVTTLSLTGVNDASGAFTSNVVCTLTAADNVSGVNQTMYSFDGNSWMPYTGPFTISTTGNTTVFYRSADNAGNQEVAGLKVITITGSASTTASAQPSPGFSLLLPLLAIGLAGIYGIRKWQ